MKQRDWIIIICLAIVLPLIAVFAIQASMQLTETMQSVSNIDYDKIPPLITELTN